MKGTLQSFAKEFFENHLADEPRHSGEEDRDGSCLGLGRHDEDGGRGCSKIQINAKNNSECTSSRMKVVNVGTDVEVL